MAKLSTSNRKSLDKSQFAVPEKAPGAGSYPIPDPGHAKDALARASGKPEESRVKAAVRRKFPTMNVTGTSSVVRPKTLVKDRITAAIKNQKSK